MALLLTSCSATGRGIDRTTDPVVIDTACKWVGFIYISSEDTLTDGTARQILAHNKTLAKNCGAPSK